MNFSNTQLRDIQGEYDQGKQHDSTGRTEAALILMILKDAVSCMWEDTKEED